MCVPVSATEGQRKSVDPKPKASVSLASATRRLQ